MTDAEVWRHLGIRATSDVKTIRSAYAARLRTMDVDAERDGFAMLRAARDQALAWAASHLSDAAGTGEAASSQPSSDDGIGHIPCNIPALAIPLITAAAPSYGCVSTPAPPMVEAFVSRAITSAFTPPGTHPTGQDIPLPLWWTPVFHLMSASAGGIGLTTALQNGGHDRALYALLFPDDEAESNRPLEEKDVADATGHITAIHSWAQAGDVDYHARVDHWMSETLARAWPRSGPLLAHAATLFGWEAVRGQVDAPPAIDYINRRLAADQFYAAVLEKKHPLNLAWRQLSAPTRAGQAKAYWRKPKQVAELLGTIRRDHPELESRLDWHRVALWDSRGKSTASGYQGFTGIGGITIAVLVIRVLVMVGQMASGPSSSPEPPTALESSLDAPSDDEVTQNPNPRPGDLTAQKADIDRAILMALGPDVTQESLRSRAPLVYQLFRSNWHLALEQNQSLARYVNGMVGILRDRYALLARQSGNAALIQYQKLRLREARLLKGQDWTSCAHIMQSGHLAEPALLPEEVQEEERSRIAQLILAMPDNPSPLPSSESFTIPGAVVHETVERSGLSLSEVSASFQGNGGDKNVCLTDIALLEAVLADTPAVRRRLIHHI